MEIKYVRDINLIRVRAEDDGVTIDCGWTLLLSRLTAVEYVRTYNANTSAGFLRV